MPVRLLTDEINTCLSLPGLTIKYEKIKQTDYNYIVILASDFLSIGRNAVRLFSTNSTTERTH